MGQIVVRRRVTRREADRLPVVAHGRVEVSRRLVVQVAEVVVDRSVRRLQREGAPVVRDRRLEIAERLRGVGAIHPGRRKRGPQLDGAAEVAACHVEVPGIVFDQAQHVPRVGERGLERYRALRGLPRLVDALRLAQREGEVGPHFGEIRAQREPRAQTLDAFVPAAGREGRHSGLDVGLRGIRQFEAVVDEGSDILDAGGGGGSASALSEAAAGTTARISRRTTCSRSFRRPRRCANAGGRIRPPAGST